MVGLAESTKTEKTPAELAISGEPQGKRKKKKRKRVGMMYGEAQPELEG
jgi:hypothetical protein